MRASSLLSFVMGTGMAFWVAAMPVRLNDTASAWQIVPEHSHVTFHAVHMGFMEVDGQIPGMEGDIHLADRTPMSTPASVRGHVRIPVARIDTDNRLRDRSLRSEPFLDAASHPFILVDATSEGWFLTIRGQQRPMHPESIRYAISADTLRMEARYTLSRSAFDLDLGTMDALVDDAVEVEAYIVAVR